MNCENAFDLISMDIDGELSPEQAEQLQAHLRDCADCRRLAEAMRAIHSNVSALEVPAPEGLAEGVMRRIGQQSGTVKKPKRRFFGPGTGFGMVAAVLVLLMGTGVIRVPKPQLKEDAGREGSA